MTFFRTEEKAECPGGAGKGVDSLNKRKDLDGSPRHQQPKKPRTRIRASALECRSPHVRKGEMNKPAPRFKRTQKLLGETET